jgi:hypothetical protein
LIKGLASILEAALAVNPLKMEVVFLECLLDQVKHLGPATENDAGNNQLNTVTAVELNREGRPLDGL